MKSTRGRTISRCKAWAIALAICASFGGETSAFAQSSTRCEAQTKIATEAIANAEAAEAIASECEARAERLERQRDDYRSEAGEATGEAREAAGRILELSARLELTDRNLARSRERAVRLEVAIEREREVGFWLSVALAVSIAAAGGVAIWGASR